jgi:uncharacterized protein
MSKRNPVSWFEIYVHDMDRARKFYETVLGQEMTDMPMPDDSGAFGQMISFPGDEKSPGSSGALVKHEMGTPSAAGTLVYFSCEDCAVELDRVEAAGGKVLQPKFPIGEYGFCGVASDTEGNSIGFHSMN